MVYYSPCQPVRNADGSWSESTSTTQYYNPLSMINEDTNQTIYRRMQLTGKGELNILPELTWTAQYSYLYNQNVLSEYHSTKSQIVKTHGQARRSTYMDNKQVFETFGNFTHSFPGYHRLGLMVGYSWEQNNENDGFGLTVKDFYNDAVKYYNLTYANQIDGIDAVESGAEFDTAYDFVLRTCQLLVCFALQLPGYTAPRRFVGIRQESPLGYIPLVLGCMAHWRRGVGAQS